MDIGCRAIERASDSKNSSRRHHLVPVVHEDPLEALQPLALLVAQADQHHGHHFLGDVAARDTGVLALHIQHIPLAVRPEG